jgi:hypothetical protein
LVEKTELSRFGQIPERTALEQIVPLPDLTGTEIAFLNDYVEGDSLNEAPNSSQTFPNR